MKKITTLLAIIFCVFTPIWAQKNTPQEKSIVNKEYDENGTCTESVDYDENGREIRREQPLYYLPIGQN